MRKLRLIEYLDRSPQSRDWIPGLKVSAFNTCIFCQVQSTFQIEPSLLCPVKGSDLVPITNVTAA